MRTTIRIDDQLYRTVKARAAVEGRTVASVIEDALRQVVARTDDGPGTAPPRLPVFGDRGTHPGIDVSDSRALRDALDAGEPVDALR